MDLRRSMELAGRNLELCLCRTGGYLPYHKLDVDQRLRSKLQFMDLGHNVGRWWDAMLRLEDAVGYPIPAVAEAEMLKNLDRWLDNPDGLTFTKGLDQGPPAFDLHSLREGLLALNALARYRGSEWAVEKGHRMLKSIHRLSRPDASWDIESFDYYSRLNAPEAQGGKTERVEVNAVYGNLGRPNVSHNGRLIEALVWYYETTADPLALALADRFARYHLAHTTRPDGAFNTSSNARHMHSYLGTLRGLLLYGLLTKQHSYVDAVAATYRVTVRDRSVKESGWVSHNIAEGDSGRGEDRLPEVASAGDATQIAMWLGLRCGYPEFLDDVERVIRSRILPSQITRLPQAKIPSAIDRDQELGRLWNDEEYSNVGERILGAFGGMQIEPHAGKRSTTDVTAAVVHTLADVYGHIVEAGDLGLIVNFHFDYEDDAVRISTERDEGARVTVSPKTAANVLVRVPRWTPPESVRLTVGGTPVPPEMVGDYVRVGGGVSPAEIELSYALPRRRTRESAQGIEFELDWRGDEVTGVCPNSDFFPFYPTADGCNSKYDWRSDLPIPG